MGGVDDAAALEREQLAQRVWEKDIARRRADVDHGRFVPQAEHALGPRCAANGVRIELPFQAGDEHGRSMQAEQSACRSPAERQPVARPRWAP